MLNRRADLTMVRVSSRRSPQATTARCMTSSARVRLVTGRATWLRGLLKNTYKAERTKGVLKCQQNKRKHDDNTRTEKLTLRCFNSLTEQIMCMMSNFLSYIVLFFCDSETRPCVGKGEGVWICRQSQRKARFPHSSLVNWPACFSAFEEQCVLYSRCPQLYLSQNTHTKWRHWNFHITFDQYRILKIDTYIFLFILVTNFQ